MTVVKDAPDTEALLEKKSEEANYELLDAYSSKDATLADRKDAEFSVGMAALARYDEPAAPYQIRKVERIKPWIAIARKSIEQFIAEDPDARSILKKSIFFSEDEKVQFRLSRFISGRIKAGGILDKETLENRVINGEIERKD